MIGYQGLSDFPDTLEAWTEKLHPEDAGFVLQSFQETIADKTKKYDVNYRLQTKSEGYRWYLNEISQNLFKN